MQERTIELDITKGENARYFRICRIGFVFSFFQHALLALIFYLLSVPILPIYNLFSVIIFLVANILNERGHFYKALTLAYLEIVVHQVLATYIIGWETGFHLFIIFNIMLPLLTKKGHILWKAFIMGTSFIAFLYLLLFERTATPQMLLSPTILSTFAIVNKLSFILVLILIAEGFNRTVLRYEEKLNAEISYANSLLLNILPKSIVKRVGRETGAVAEGFEMVSVLFADIVGFTKFAESIPPDRLVSLLDNLFTRFDLLTDQFHCEKIKTIGDAYMVSAGVPDRRSDHADCLVDFAKAMLEEVKNFNDEHNLSLSIRIGIHSGPVVAGVIGKKKFSYDLWGDTVNTASRMESSGIQDGIQISHATRESLSSRYETISRGIIQIKGKGTVETFLVL